MNFLKGIDVHHGWAYKGRRCRAPRTPEKFPKNPLNSVKNYSFQAKFFDFLKIFNEKFAAFSKIVRNLLEFFANIWTII